MADIDPQLLRMLAQAMQQDNGNTGLQQELGAYDALGPDAYKRHVGTNTLGQRSQLAGQNFEATQGMLDRQLAQAQALQRPSGQKYSTVGGAVGGGIGDALGSFFGGMKSNELMGQMGAANDARAQQQGGYLDSIDTSNVDVGTARMNAMRKFLAQQEALKQQMKSQPVSDASLLEPLTLGG